MISRIQCQISEMQMIYRCIDGDQTEKILGELKKQQIIIEEAKEETRVYIYDTFDWRLFHKNFALILSGTTLTFRQLPGHTAGISEKGINNDKKLHIPPGTLLYREIKPLIKNRALLQHAAAHIHTKKFKLSGKNKNNTMEIEIKKIVPGSPAASGIPGRPEEPCRSAESGIYLLFIDDPAVVKAYLHPVMEKKKSKKHNQKKQDIFYYILEVCAVKPGRYSKKMNIKLIPSMTTETGCRIILGVLLHIMTSNEKGIKNDYDSEFLHDFRVALRRTRSLLSQVKKVFPKHLVQPFRARFKYYAKLTNEPRDIDVYLQKIEYFNQCLPGDVKNGLTPFTAWLTQKHKQLYKTLEKELDTDSYNTLIHTWYTFLNTPVKPENKPPAAKIPMMTTAKQVIGKHYHSVLETGSGIREDSPPGAFHALRIECKKLRYLLEFFLSLFPGVVMKKIITRLKMLQDNLGTYQDIQVQKQILADFLIRENPSQDRGEETKKALTLLSDYYQKEEKRVRGEFFSLFKEFNSKKMRFSFYILCTRYFKDMDNTG